jgi:alkylation response protein AidB-like acyl-CoA dehydrogenase
MTLLAENEDLRRVRESARGLLQSQWPASRAVKMASQPEDMQTVWKSAAGQGWTALGIDDETMGLAAALVLLQELGRASCPIPLLDAVLANAVLAASDDAPATALLKRLQTGHAAVTWVFGPHSGDADAFGLTIEGRSLTGRCAFVENTAMATHLAVVTGRPGEVALLAIDARGVSVTQTPGLNTPALAEVRLQGAPVELINSKFALSSLAPLARLMLSARALGSAQYGLELLTDYVKVRTQFGHKIGSYQAIQHKLANCLIQVEICRLALLRAGFSSPVDRIYAGAIASANAGAMLRQVVLELHHGFGGVSFWDEHELPRHFRRIHGDLTRLGGVQQSRRDIAGHLLSSPHGARIPDLDLGDKANAFRGEVRAWLKENWDGSYPVETYELPVNHRKARQDFSRKLGAKGWLGITWPKAYGGQERSAMEHLAFEEEMAYCEAPVTFHNTAANMMGPSFVAFGSSAQKSYFLPGIAKGEISFALGYSEPDTGSDLASIKTSAARTTGGGWVINGQKIYTSTAGFASHVWLAVRTDPTSPKHGGISVFAVPLTTPGITMQPMSGLNGHRSNVVFYDDVKVPDDALVGEENGGWKVITAALAFERVALAAVAARGRAYFDQLLDYLGTAYRDGRPMGRDSLVRDRVGALAAEIEGARLLAVQTAQVMERGEVPLHEAAMVKVYASELMERLAEAAFDLVGAGAALAAGSVGALVDGRFEYAVRDALLYTIGGGTNEIQRTLIALRGLDLPRSQ